MAGNKGEAEPERKETRSKVDEDRKHEYPFYLAIIAKKNVIHTNTKYSVYRNNVAELTLFSFM